MSRTLTVPHRDHRLHLLDVIEVEFGSLTGNRRVHEAQHPGADRAWQFNESREISRAFALLPLHDPLERPSRPGLQGIRIITE